MNIPDIIQSLEEKIPGAVTDRQPGWITVRKEQVLAVFQFLKDGPAAFESLHCVTAVDRKNHVEVVYHVYTFQHRQMLTIKVVLSNEDLNVDSLISVWASADWLEREVYDLFGVRFTNHPDLRRILNPDNWTEHPLRKDFKRAGVILRPAK